MLTYTYILLPQLHTFQIQAYLILSEVLCILSGSPQFFHRERLGRAHNTAGLSLEWGCLEVSGQASPSNQLLDIEN